MPGDNSVPSVTSELFMSGNNSVPARTSGFIIPNDNSVPVVTGDLFMSGDITVPSNVVDELDVDQVHRRRRRTSAAHHSQRRRRRTSAGDTDSNATIASPPATDADSNGTTVSAVSVNIPAMQRSTNPQDPVPDATDADGQMSQESYGPDDYELDESEDEVEDYDEAMDIIPCSFCSSPISNMEGLATAQSTAISPGNLLVGNCEISQGWAHARCASRTLPMTGPIGDPSQRRGFFCHMMLHRYG